ncbi:protein YgfX [Aquicella lusitana]|uniref:Toxin CptA n=1 Tax=Aquicella lusitana TaxID=254246 RepID=A0A370GFX1_9COXI|nr:protein YgfX [Aquicella lusitana]RDI42692.1 hypothetical protein C8D86_11321 [Aquicella lusitana]VVC73453.1 hypothetical protein AQULUS_11930 [Aquicella lusitana]
MPGPEFKLRPSRQYLALIGTVFLGSLGMVLLLPIEAWIKILICLLLFIYAGGVLWQFALLRSPHAVISLRQNQHGKWLLRTSLKVYEAELCGDSTVTPFVSILRFRLPKQGWSMLVPACFKPGVCIVFRDSLKQDDYRKLLIHLRMS